MSKVKANPSNINIGLSEKDRSNIGNGLSRMRLLTMPWL